MYFIRKLLRWIWMVAIGCSGWYIYQMAQAQWKVSNYVGLSVPAVVILAKILDYVIKNPYITARIHKASLAIGMQSLVFSLMPMVIEHKLVSMDMAINIVTAVVAFFFMFSLIGIHKINATEDEEEDDYDYDDDDDDYDYDDDDE